MRSIPAWAGEPRWPSAGCRAGRVHPRVAGGARYPGAARSRMAGPSPRGRGASAILPTVPPRHGPSPRGRGSLLRIGRAVLLNGSIPAWAGEPSMDLKYGHGVKVHPRVGGGAQTTPRVLRYADGPSPRGRGSPEIQHRRIRGCGPSPRGRGSQLMFSEPVDSPRSIPAWAGEPAYAGQHRDSHRVHPRVGGGAWSFRSRNTDSRGPSPRGAGEAVAAPPCAGSRAGPSPRGRGSRRPPHRAPHRKRSIPAWAGAGGKTNPRAGLEGPSPRGRGNPAGRLLSSA